MRVAFNREKFLHVLPEKTIFDERTGSTKYRVNAKRLQFKSILNGATRLVQRQRQLVIPNKKFLGLLKSPTSLLAADMET